VKKSLLATAALLLAACSRDIQNSDAIRAGVVEYLQGRMAQTGLDVNRLSVDITSVSFQRDEARATVYFRPKSAPAGGGMQMNYVLDRKGSKWVVRGRTENGANPHGGGNLPLPLPPSGQPPTGMPPGHPPVGSKQ
jgi:hypothetical protein